MNNERLQDLRQEMAHIQEKYSGSALNGIVATHAELVRSSILAILEDRRPDGRPS